MTAKILLTLFFSFTALYAATPSLYNMVGDPLYEALDGYQQLLADPEFEKMESVERFVDAAEKLYSEGMALDTKSTSLQRKEYIQQLRQLSKEMESLEQEVSGTLDRLAEQKAYKPLSGLQKNPYAFLRTHPAVAKAALMVSMESGTVDMTKLSAQARLYVTLDNLKKKLIKARETGSSEAPCLNDITGINYWMLKAEEFKESGEACKGLEACEQVEQFLKTAKKSCTEEHPMFQLSRESSSSYRTALKMEFYEACR